MEQGKIMEAEVLTVRVEATPTELMAPHPRTQKNFLQGGCPSCRPTNSIKALKAKNEQFNRILKNLTIKNTNQAQRNNMHNVRLSKNYDAL